MAAPQVQNRAIADQFVGVYGPHMDWTLPPICHITRTDARRLVQTVGCSWINRGADLRVPKVDVVTDNCLMIFVLPGDQAEEPDAAESTIEQAERGRDPEWRGAINSLNPTGWTRRFKSARTIDAHVLRVFWARVVIEAWRGWVRGTRGVEVRKVRAIPDRGLRL